MKRNKKKIRLTKEEKRFSKFLDDTLGEVFLPANYVKIQKLKKD